ncbi:ATP-binding protein [Skermania sp. ID1734]|uniref:ATP-binding protein n=1 Tax=Skermania sp. ID1734 TaxID=2597516 RepID=UPI00118170E1|nr:ATP-binding protein [Skermania sp. ID1734]TSD98089.1 ATP-binding protein [Skermania sp. ID1734]
MTRMQPTGVSRVRTLSFTAAATAREATRARDRVRRWAWANDIEADTIYDMVLAVYEAIANVIDYAYPERPGSFTVQGRATGGRVTVQVSDHGQWAPCSVPRASNRGRGIALMKNLADHVELRHDSQGTDVVLAWNTVDLPVDDSHEPALDSSLTGQHNDVEQRDTDGDLVG